MNFFDKNKQNKIESVLSKKRWNVYAAMATTRVPHETP